ncbi:hypothetical protein Snas_4408 [Stackebrandtia nassauensis DSM 44728]|uniref:Uncharacterized protein n=1 Tax=Stackebrandtia nassauensis (strain DSM 44728 / CIP 108903 / NRRL B-16338 / NBRC 102104 / LLR-40K-21) TaxID=446470 RepID=D3Q3Y7_STANL|nr:chitinase [Stackebrandtia nassauensis]ADD44054.1 hypothetical protein Snas_4408 [Stackebrandtia nassauensis DSM 44728]
MKRRTRLVAFGAAAVLAVGGGTGYAFANETEGSSGSGTSTSPDLSAAEMAAAPYLFEGWGDPPDVKTVMDATGVKAFTMAFILSDGTCNPSWDSQRPLEGGVDQKVIEEVRANGGDVMPSIGGWQGDKLGPRCGSPEELAGAYQKVIDAYGLKAIDVDIENTDEFENHEVQERILSALKIVKEKNPDIKTIVTFGTGKTGPNEHGVHLIEKSKELQANIDVFTIMPFDFGSSDIYTDTIAASEGLRDQLKKTYGWDDAEAYAHMGISGMNGMSDQSEETSPDTWTKIRDWAKQNSLARFTFWALNRDRPCPGGGTTSNCSGIDQKEWEFTSITAGFAG